MPDLRSLKPKRVIETPSIDSYSIEQDPRYFGFKNKIFWKYTVPNVAVFRVFRAKMPKAMLKRKYVVTTTALERLTPLRAFPTKNTILFNKSAFSQSDMLRFENSNSNRFDLRKGDLSTYNFKEVAIIRANSSQQYEYVDRNVKFGETYVYTIVAITHDLIESGRSAPVFLTVEDVVHPEAPIYLSSEMVDSGILLTMSTKEEGDVVAFDIYRKSSKEKDFTFFDRVDKQKKERSINYLDTFVFPGNSYEYKVYAVDYFGNRSYSALVTKCTNDLFVEKRGDIPLPKMEVKVFEDAVYIKTLKEHPDVIGAKVERQDVWRFETSFEQKTNKGNAWPHVTMFLSDEVEQIDLSAKRGRTYRYRVSLIKKNGTVASLFVTPHLFLENGLVYSNFKLKKEEEKEVVKAKNLQVEVLEKKRNPPLVKFSWDIIGKWDHLTIEYEDKTVRVDNIHSEMYFQDLEKGKKYVFTMKVWDSEGNKLDELKGAAITL